MNGYQQAEKTGRGKYEDMFGDKYVIAFSSYDYEKWDFKQTARTDTNRTHVGDIKNEGRPYSKYIYKGKDGGFLIDFDKCRNVKKEALNDGRTGGLIVGFFTDMVIAWDITKIEWEKRGEWRQVNKDGQNYGEKEWEYVTYLYLKEAIYVKANDNGIVN